MDLAIGTEKESRNLITDAFVFVKVGGSLLNWEHLPARLSAYLAERRGERLLLLAGGGGLVDEIRQLDRIHGLGDERCHHLAIQSLDLSAAVLSLLVPGLAVVVSINTRDDAWEKGLVPVLAPGRILEDDD